jgi:hypothetical protein
MSHQIMQLLSPEAPVGIKIHKKKFRWTKPLPNEAINDGYLMERKESSKPFQQAS